MKTNFGQTKFVYFNYHASLKKKIDQGMLTGYKIVHRYKNIAPCMILFFCDGLQKPVRVHMFDYYLDMFDKLKLCVDNNSMKIATLFGTRLKTNNYLINFDGKNVLVEASAPLDEILKVLNGENLDAVLITHSHFDHIFTIGQILQKFPSCTLVAHKNALKNLVQGQRWVEPLSLPKNVVTIDGDVTLNFLPKPVSVLCTPGHSNCSVCYVIDDKIFSGDTMFFQTCGRCDFPTGDEFEMKNSLKKLLKFAPHFKVFPGHGQSTTIENEQQTYLFLED